MELYEENIEILQNIFYNLTFVPYSNIVFSKKFSIGAVSNIFITFFTLQKRLFVSVRVRYVLTYTFVYNPNILNSMN
jgi:hypothetical protein